MNLPTTPFLRIICMTVRSRSVSVAPSASLPCSLKPTTWGMSMDTGWPSMAASASIPPTPQPKTPRPLTMVVCESVPTRVSGYIRGGPPVADDAGVRRHHAEIVERILSPAQEQVALAVALEFQVGIALEAQRSPEAIHLDRVIDDQLDGLQGIDL